MNHELNSLQRHDLEKNYGNPEVVVMDKDLKNNFGNIDPNKEVDVPLATDLINWIKSVATPGEDMVLYQGEMGLLVLVVPELMSLGFDVVHATSTRAKEEFEAPDGSVISQGAFVHCQFRQYQMFS